MTKTQLWEEVQKLLDENKHTKKLAEGLEVLLKPKSGGGSSAHPSYEENGIIYHWCRFHQTYEPEGLMVMSKGKSKGYCKASISKWNKTNSNIKKLDSEAVDAMAEGDFEKAQAIAEESKDLRAKLNLPEYYNFEQDWADFEK